MRIPNDGGRLICGGESGAASRICGGICHGKDGTPGTRRQRRMGICCGGICRCDDDVSFGYDCVITYIRSTNEWMLMLRLFFSGVVLSGEICHWSSWWWLPDSSLALFDSATLRGEDQPVQSESPQRTSLLWFSFGLVNFAVSGANAVRHRSSTSPTKASAPRPRNPGTIVAPTNRRWGCGFFL